MAYKNKPVDYLDHFLPAGAYSLVKGYLDTYKIGLTITKSRQSKYGDYMYDPAKDVHKISVNGTLNPYEFLVTLLHEIAHMITFLQYGAKVAPHGKEWKRTFGKILEQFIMQGIFPDKVRHALQAHLGSVKSSHCYDATLIKVLQSYNAPTGKVYISDIGIGKIFCIDDGSQYKVVEKLRTRYKCLSLSDGRAYLFPSLYEVDPV